MHNLLTSRMPDYSKGKIYKVVNDLNDTIYVGSTCSALYDRMAGHRCDAKRYRTSPLYLASNELGMEHFKIKLIKEFPCTSKAELHDEEYRIMQKYVARGISIYNAITDPTSLSLQHRQKMSESNRKRGSVFLDANAGKPGWRFGWYIFENGVYRRRTKFFSIRKYGEEEARKMAIALQDETYPV